MNALFNTNNPLGNYNNLMSNGPLGLISQFNTFKNNFQGDPKAQVQSLLQSGKMTQQQFNQFSQLANQLRSILG